MVHIGQLKHGATDLAQFGYCLSGAQFVTKSITEDGVLKLLYLQGVQCQSYTLKHILHIRLKLIYGALFISMSPRTRHLSTGNPQSKMVILAIGIQRILRPSILARLIQGFPFGSIKIVALAELKESEVGVLMTYIMRKALQASEQHRFPQYVKIGAQGVKKMYQPLRRTAIQPVIVGGTGKRVVQNLIKSAAHQLFGDKVLKLL